MSEKTIDIRGILSFVLFIAFVVTLFSYFREVKKNDMLVHEIEEVLDDEMENNKKIASLQDSIDKYREIEPVEIKISDVIGKHTSEEIIDEYTPKKKDSSKYIIEGSNRVDYIAESLVRRVEYEGYISQLEELHKQKDKLILSLEAQNTILKSQNKTYQQELLRVKKEIRKSKRNSNFLMIASGIVLATVVILE